MPSASCPPSLATRCTFRTRPQKTRSEALPPSSPYSSSALILLQQPLLLPHRCACTPVPNHNDCQTAHLVLFCEALTLGHFAPAKLPLSASRDSLRRRLPTPRTPFILDLKQYLVDVMDVPLASRLIQLPFRSSETTVRIPRAAYRVCISSTYETAAGARARTGRESLVGIYLSRSVKGPIPDRLFSLQPQRSSSPVSAP